MSKGHFFRSLKGKILVMGALGIAAALVIGLVGVTSINRNAKNSEIVSLVDEINVLQSQNLANDALYQYYVDESYLKTTMSNLDEMEQKAVQLSQKGDPSIQESVSSVIDNIDHLKANYNEISRIHSERGYADSVGKYQEYAASSQALRDSFGSLVNHNDWVEIQWMTCTFGEEGTPANIDGKTYTKEVYDLDLPETGKRNSLIFRVGGTFTYKGDYYIKNIQLTDGSEAIPVELNGAEIAEMSGDGLESAEITDFGGEAAIKVTGKFDGTLDRWEEVSITLSAVDYPMESHSHLKYELYLDPSLYEEGIQYKYGGAVSGVYGFASRLSELDNMVSAYSKLVVEGKDITSNLAEIENLFTELGDNIPKYTTDPALAQASLSCLETKKGIFDQLKAEDATTLALKADNESVKAQLSSLCASVQDNAIENMNMVRASVTVFIVIILIISIIVLALILARVSIGINRSVKSFHSAIEEIAAGKITVRADDSGHDEFAIFASSLNGFLDTLENTITQVKNLTVVLATSGDLMEESATRTKVVAGEINETIGEISKGAGEQAKDIETSSQRVMDIITNIRGITDNVSNLSEKAASMSSDGQVAKVNMNNLTASSSSTNEAFGKIVEQVNKTDESVGKIQDAVSLISSVANQINLLSLNASIEAARAGEAGKGFAVVASEISNLADQTNQSTAIIEGIIKGLSEESNKTVATINEVTTMIENQKNSIDTTGNIFAGVSDGISFTSDAVVDVLKQAKDCEKSGQEVSDLMTNLSAISEENAASAETTSTAMTRLNEETAKLADASVELKKHADNLRDDLEFFVLN